MHEATCSNHITELWEPTELCLNCVNYSVPHSHLNAVNTVKYAIMFYQCLDKTRTEVCTVVVKLQVFFASTIPLPWFSITVAMWEQKLAWSESGQNKCSLISVVQRQKQLHTNIHTQRHRLERRLCLGFLLLEQRFMVGESCRESLRLNYTDGEHQIQEKLPRLRREWWGLDESGIERKR